MPKYTTKKKRGQKRNQERIKRAIPRDRRHLLQWAVEGTDLDYAKLKEHAAGLLDQVPSYIDKDAVAELASGASRETVAKAVISEKHKRKGNWFTDALSWVIDKIPDDWELEWAKDLGEAALKPYRGTTMTEEDSIYAQLVNQSYMTNKPEEMGDWSRVPEFDSNYISVWDNVDGHRFIGVRGTELKLTDLEEDMEDLFEGQTDDLLSTQLNNILDNTKPGTVVDVGAHSLGTSLVAEAYQADEGLQDRVRETFWYNPVFSPFALETGNVTDKYESDDRVRYFINLMDLVSIGDLGSKGPNNVVYRTKFGALNPLEAHQLNQWYGNVEMNLQQNDTPFEPEYPNVLEPTDDLPQGGLEDAMGGPGILLDFGPSFNTQSLDFG